VAWTVERFVEERKDEVAKSETCDEIDWEEKANSKGEIKEEISMARLPSSQQISEVFLR
jgi:hypothetical protein